jgi:hypothetical protein
MKWEGINYIYLSCNKDRWLAFVGVVMNHWIPYIWLSERLKASLEGLCFIE